MKQKKFSKKLTLNHKTIANLNASGMEGVKGGALPVQSRTTECETEYCTIGQVTCFGTCQDGCDPDSWICF